jgi:hypothetical protein
MPCFNFFCVEVVGRIHKLVKWQQVPIAITFAVPISSIIVDNVARSTSSNYNAPCNSFSFFWLVSTQPDVEEDAIYFTVSRSFSAPCCVSPNQFSFGLPADDALVKLGGSRRSAHCTPSDQRSNGVVTQAQKRRPCGLTLKSMSSLLISYEERFSACI